VTRRILLLAALLLIIPGTSPAYYAYGYHPRSSFYYPYYGYPYRPYPDIELSRIRRELRGQRLQMDAQARQQGQELNLLRQQALANHQVTAQQACYYRSTGGFELCADLFEPDTLGLVDCEELVVLRNPSCN
jgi:hypothetical protein